MYFTNYTFYTIYVLFYDNNSEKYSDSRENRGAMVIIPSGVKIFRSQNTKYSKN